MEDIGFISVIVIAILMVMISFIILIGKIIARFYIDNHKQSLYSDFEATATASKALEESLIKRRDEYLGLLVELGLCKVHRCSNSVVANAENDVLKYILKYSDVTNEDSCLIKLDYCINWSQDFESLFLKLGALRSQLLKKLPRVIRPFVNKDTLPYIISGVSYKITKLETPQFNFYYVSPAGRSSNSFDIDITSELLRSIRSILYRKNSASEHAKIQRSAMTNDLREAIKQRDNYTCCICGNSVLKEPNLLLEVDHIIPVSKGGVTEADNLQTLCWRCNRNKGNSIIDRNMA